MKLQNVSSESVYFDLLTLVWGTLVTVLADLDYVMGIRRETLQSVLTFSALPCYHSAFRLKIKSHISLRYIFTLQKCTNGQMNQKNSFRLGVDPGFP